MIIAPFSAIPSWEGFEYQRHIALYVSLSHIWKEIESRNENDINLYKLGIEGEEDFSIIKGDKYISLHQVKQGEVRLDNMDKTCFILSTLQYAAEKSYFHVVPGSSVPLDFVEKTLQSIDGLLIQLENEVKTEEEFKRILFNLSTNGQSVIKGSDLYKQNEGKYILISKINSNAPKGSLYKILSFICDGNRETDNVNKAVVEARKELSGYKDILTGKLDSDIWNIHGEQFLLMENVIQKSCVYIEKILKVAKPEGNIFYDHSYYQDVYDRIVIFSKNIISEHNTSAKKNVCKLEFSKIHELIVKDYKGESNTTEYQYYLLLKLILDLFKKYPSSIRSDCPADDCDSCLIKNSCNLRFQVAKISDISHEDKKDFLYKLLLRTPKVNLPSDAVINNLFMTLLKKIECLKYNDSNVILAKKGEEIYRLTLDENEFFEQFEDQFNKELNLNNTDKFRIYESDVLITDRLNSPCYKYNQNNFNVMGASELNELEDVTSDSVAKQRIDFNKPKIMRIISKEIAEKELENND